MPRELPPALGQLLNWLEHPHKRASLFIKIITGFFEIREAEP